MTRQCQLRFAIGLAFVDEVELDIVPLDICGIFLGSPCMIEKPFSIELKISINSLKME